MGVINTCQIVVGRLVEIDVGAGYRTIADLDRMIALMSEQLARVPEPVRIVIAADWRACRLLTPEVAERAVQMLASGNPRIERSAILHSEVQPISVLQALRLTREARLADRRVFTDVGDMEAWLGEVLVSAEAERVHALLHKTMLDDV